MWIFEFSEVAIKERVMTGGPWSFDRQILILNKFNGLVPPSRINFIHSPFWIHVHDMPLLCMSRAMGTKIGRTLGDLEDVDVAGDGAEWLRSLQLRVSIDLTQPLV